MATTLNRRDFLKLAGGGVAGGVAVLVVGRKLGWMTRDTAMAAVPVVNLDFHITDAIKEMGVHETGLLADGTRVGNGNPALCYFWMYKATADGVAIKSEVPGPTIMATTGDTVHIKVTNDLDEDHSFVIPQLGVNSGAIVPGGIWEGDITATKAGAYLYYDNLNSPVNRMMGLHGAIIVLPAAAAAGHKLTPYEATDVTPGVQKLFDDFGTSTHFPGLAWEEGSGIPGDPGYCPPKRHYLWLLHQASPRLFAEVGEYQPKSATSDGNYPASEFLNKFLHGGFPTARINNSSISTDVSYKPMYFTINGQHGFFAHDSAYVTPMQRVGEPCIVYILNAGLWVHSMHLHANHFYVTNVNDVVQENPIWLDVFNVHPMDRVDYVIPFMRSPDVPNARGIGYPDAPLKRIGSDVPVWPPVQEFNTYMPGVQAPPAGTFFNASGEVGRNRQGVTIDLGQRMSPLCYPMHDHSEPSQTSQGGNYNTGLISGMYILGDRNTPGHMDFPMEHDFAIMKGDVYGCEITGTHPCAPEPGHTP